MRPALIAAVAALTGTAAAAEDWSYSTTLYLWLPGLSGTIDTDFGTVTVEPDGEGDSLFKLRGGFLGNVTASNGPLTFAADLLYARLGAAEQTPFGTLYSDASVDQDLRAFSAYAFYSVAQTPDVDFSLGAGFRSFDLALGVDLGAGALPAASQTLAAQWMVPVVAARLRVPLGQSAFLAGFADWGATSGGDSTWQTYAGLGYAFTESWSAQLGYRHMALGKTIGGLDVDLALDGGVLAVTYSF